jgi:hypothetical protein
VRDVDKNKWLAEYFAEQYKEAKFDLVAVPDMTAEGCYDNIVDGMSSLSVIMQMVPNLTLRDT